MNINRGRGYEEGPTYQGQTPAAARVGWGFLVAATRPACDEIVMPGFGSVRFKGPFCRTAHRTAGPVRNMRRTAHRTDPHRCGSVRNGSVRGALGSNLRTQQVIMVVLHIREMIPPTTALATSPSDGGSETLTCWHHHTATPAR